MTGAMPSMVMASMTGPQFAPLQSAADDRRIALVAAYRAELLFAAFILNLSESELRM